MGLTPAGWCLWVWNGALENNQTNPSYQNFGGRYQTMTVVDADGHVEEGLTMFSSLEAEYLGRRPLPLAFDRNTIYGDRNAVWLIDGKTYPKLSGKGGVTFLTPTVMESAKRKPFSVPAQELTDVAARLKDLDQMGIDKQVIYPSLFLTTTTDNLDLEAALFRTYNSFMAEACKQSGDRLKFAAQVPIRDSAESIKELRRARDLGAVSVMLLGMAWDKKLGDKDLHPFYEEAASLGIPICVHLGWGCPALTEIFDASSNFYSGVLPVLMGFHSLMLSGVLDAIPNLKLAFLESGSLWVPYVVHELTRSGQTRKDPAEYFREGRVYISCEPDENINYLTSVIGEDSLILASDYPHTDSFREENLVKSTMDREDVPLRVREKLLSKNAQALYGI